MLQDKPRVCISIAIDLASFNTYEAKQVYHKKYDSVC
jgi:hypothetical protein